MIHAGTEIPSKIIFHKYTLPVFSGIKLLLHSLTLVAPFFCSVVTYKHVFVTSLQITHLVVWVTPGKVDVNFLFWGLIKEWPAHPPFLTSWTTCGPSGLTFTFSPHLHPLHAATVNKQALPRDHTVYKIINKTVEIPISYRSDHSWTFYGNWLFTWWWEIKAYHYVMSETSQPSCCKCKVEERVKDAGI